MFWGITSVIAPFLWVVYKLGYQICETIAKKHKFLVISVQVVVGAYFFVYF